MLDGSGNPFDLFGERRWQLPDSDQAVVAGGEKLLVVAVKGKRRDGRTFDLSLRLVEIRAPEDDASMIVRRGREIAVVAVRDRGGRMLVRGKLLRERRGIDRLAVHVYRSRQFSCVPQTQLLVDSNRSDRSAIRAQSESCRRASMAREPVDRLRLRHVPHTQRIVLCSGDERPTVGTQRKTKQRPGVARVLAHFRARLQIPELGRFIRAGRDRPLAIGREDSHQDRSQVPAQDDLVGRLLCGGGGRE